MSTEPLKDIVVIYHGDCPDGFGAAYAAWKKFGDTATYLPWKEHTALPEGLVDKTIYVVDFSFREPHLKTLNEQNKSVVVIDHHKTAQTDVTAYPQNIFDINHSGCALAWQYFHPGTETPILLQYVEDNDIWRHTLPEYREFLVSLHQNPMTFESWDQLIESLKDENYLINFIAKGSLLAKYEDQLVTRIMSGRERVLFEGHEIYAVNATSIFRDMVANNLAALNEQEGRIAFAIVYYKKHGMVTLSLRSRGNVDVATMAEKYGGGGHKNAAAIRVKSFADLPFTFLE